MKTYRVNSNPKSFRGLLRQFQNDLFTENKDKMEQLVAKIAELGASRVTIYLNNVGVSGTGGYAAYLEPTQHGYKIIAKGENVIMAEFGTGDDVKALESLEKGDIIIRSGSWSADHKQMYTWYGYWYHDRRKYTGENGAHAFHYAKQDMISNIENIANEVFK